MKRSVRAGFSFGLASGIITTLGLMVGLNAGTHSRIAVIGGILTIAIADAFSDALGMHFSEESNLKRTTRQIWLATIATFFSKLFFALTFMVPVLTLSLDYAVIASVIWGLSLLFAVSLYLAKKQSEKWYAVVGEHVGIAVAVIVVTYFLGNWIAATFV